MEDIPENDESSTTGAPAAEDEVSGASQSTKYGKAHKRRNYFNNRNPLSFMDLSGFMKQSYANRQNMRKHRQKYESAESSEEVKNKAKVLYERCERDVEWNEYCRNLVDRYVQNFHSLVSLLPPDVVSQDETLSSSILGLARLAANRLTHLPEDTSSRKSPSDANNEVDENDSVQVDDANVDETS
jgi:hypothetical protein